MQENRTKLKGDRARKLIYSLLLLGLFAGFFLVPRIVGATFSREDEFIPIPLHAASLADYGADEFYGWGYSADSSLMESAIRDHDPRATDVRDRVLRIVRGFDTPVPSVTPLSLWSVPTESSMPLPMQVLAPSSTAEIVGTTGPSSTDMTTSTPGPSPTATKTASPGPVSTYTWTPEITTLPSVVPSSTVTGTPTLTGVPATTSAPADTATAAFTATPTLTTTLTFISTPTPTQIHTATTTTSPPSDPCNGISIDNFFTWWTDAEWKVTNFSGSMIIITAIWIDWPNGNDALESVEFGREWIWFGDDENPPSSMPPWFGWSRDRELRNNSDKDLEFRFERIAASTGYDLHVTFNNGCTIQIQD